MWQRDVKTHQGAASMTWGTVPGAGRLGGGGRPVLIDVFCMAGTEPYRAILEDVAEVHRRIPRERMRYALDIPASARENSTAEILALKKGLGTRRRMTTRWPAGDNRRPGT